MVIFEPFFNTIQCLTHNICSFDLEFVLEVSFRFDIYKFGRLFASSNFISPDFILLKFFIPSSKSSDRFVAVLPLK